MKHRKLRIVWSVVWGIVAALLITLWVRSCFEFDQIVYRRSISDYIALTSTRGKLAFGEVEETKFAIVCPAKWKYLHFPMRGVSNKTGSPFAVFPVSLPDNAIFILPKVSNPFVLGVTGPTNYDVSLPYWLPVTIGASITVAPWIRWRFTLRTLLITTTLVAVGLGLIVWTVH